MRRIFGRCTISWFILAFIRQWHDQTQEEPLTFYYIGHVSFAYAETLSTHRKLAHWVNWRQTGFSGDSESWIWDTWCTPIMPYCGKELMWF